MISFEEALEVVSQLPTQQQEMLVNIVKQRLTEARRKEIAQECHAALVEYREGKLVAQTALDAIADLTDYLNSTDSE